MKNIHPALVPLIVFTGFFSFVVPAHAVTGTQIKVRQVDDTIIQNVQVTVTTSPKPTSTLKIVPSKNLQIKLPLKKTNALKEIDRRLAKLDLLETKILTVKRLTDAQITALTVSINGEIKSLNDLRTQIEAETDLAVLQQEKQKIIDSYKIFALYLPEIEIINHADKIIDIADALYGKTTNAKLQQTIAEAKTKAEKAISQVIVLKPEGTDNKAILKQARDLLRESRTSLNTVYSDLKKIQ